MSDSSYNAGLQEAMDFFDLFLDQEVPLFNRQIGGLYYWHPLRFHFYEMVLQSKGWIEKQDRRKSTQKIELIKIAFSLIQHTILHNWRSDASPSDLLVMNVTGNVRETHCYSDRYTDPLLAHLSSFSVWEQPAQWRHRERKPCANHVDLDSLHAESFLLQPFYRKWEKAIRAEAAHLADWAETELEVRLSIKKIAFLIRLSFMYHKILTAPIKRRLIRKKVRCILMVNHYDPIKMLVTRIAKSLGIYVIELQHGNMGKYHVPFNFKDPLTLADLPDEIFTFGSYWNRSNRLHPGQIRLTATGMPFYEEQIKTFFETYRPPQKEKKVILIISQWTIAHVLGPIVLKLAKTLDPSEYTIQYKMHPYEYNNWRQVYSPEFQQSSVQVVCQADLYKLMADSDVHIGVYSTAVMESLVFNKILILLESYGLQFILDLVETGRAHLAGNADEVIDIIQTQKPTASDSDVSIYWEKDSIQKMKDRIEEILSRLED